MTAGAEAARVLRSDLVPRDQREPRGAVGTVLRLAAAALSLVTLYWALFGTGTPFATYGLHLAIAIPLVLLLYPGRARQAPQAGALPPAQDWLLAAVAAGAFLYTVLNEVRISDRIAYFEPVSAPDMIAGVACILTVLEATRRAVGMSIVWIVGGFFLYAVSGPYWPGPLQHRGVSLNDIIEQAYLLPGGIFNFITGALVTFAFMFMVFSVFLRAMGGDRVFTDAALALAGHRRGGPAKVAVVSSALSGMISGSSIANVVATGTMTIPLMKRVGFQPHEAAAIEAAASTGGVITPPIMGATVFLLVEFTDVPLADVLLYSAGPALLYYASIFFYIDVKAGRRGIGSLARETLPRLGRVLADGAHTFIPLVVLTAMLLAGYGPFLCAGVAVLLVIAVSWLRPAQGLRPRQILVALEASARIAIALSALGAAAAMLYALMTITGLLVKLSAIVLGLAGGSLIIGIVLVWFISYVLGLALPVAAAYVLLAATAAPALVGLGIPLFAAHMMILWFSQDSTLTPPVAMTAFVAARIAEADPTRTAWTAVLIAKGLYIVPLGFAFGDLLSPDWLEVGFDMAALMLTFLALPIAVEGWWQAPLRPLARVGFASLGVLSFAAVPGPAGRGLPLLASAAAGLLLLHLLARRGALKPA